MNRICTVVDPDRDAKAHAAGAGAVVDLIRQGSNRKFKGGGAVTDSDL